AGASWMAEYGDPDTEDWEHLRTFSPYHLLTEARAGQYPPTFVLTSTRDDRVHPGHARKFTAAMESLPADVRYWENIAGGHGGAATTEQAARMHALLHTVLWNTIGAGARPCQRGAAGCRCRTAGPAREDRSRPRHRRALADLRAVRPVRAGRSAAAAQRPDDRLSGVLGRGP